MDDITRERVWRKLLVLPDQQLYQVLDYIEFLEGKYAAGKAPEPSGLQRFAERLQDRLRGRSVAPDYITGAVSMLGMARRVMETGRDVVTGVVQTGLGVMDEVVEAGKDLLSEPAPHPGQASLPAGVVPPVAPSGPRLEGKAPAEAQPTDSANGSQAPAGANSPVGDVGPVAAGSEAMEMPPLSPPAPPRGADAVPEEEHPAEEPPK